MTDVNLEQIIFSNLIHDENYLRKIVPYMKTEYFQDNAHKVVYRILEEYFTEYNCSPSVDALKIELDTKSLNSTVHKASVEFIDSISTKKDVDESWLLEKTEKFCRDRAIYNAIMESIQIIDKSSKDKGEGAIPQLLQDALGVSFDNNVGHDFLEDVDDRYDFYHKVEERIPFDIEYFNKITRGGIPKKTLNVVLAGTGVGKTMIMCHCAAANLMDGKNVLYITLEMAEEKIAERIDANLMNVPIADLETLPRDSFHKKIDKLKKKTMGKLIIKEYPTGSVGSNHFRHLLNELKAKKKFQPDIIYIDYLNLCSSSRLKMGANVNTYSYVKSIAEELRGLAMEFNLPIFSATQTNRSGFTSSDVGLEDTSESFGLPQTCDFMFAAITNEELEELNQIMIKQLKNRYNDPSTNRRFVVGVDRSKMKLYNLEDSAQKNLVNDSGARSSKPDYDTPVMDNTAFGERLMSNSSRRDKVKNLFG